MQAKRLDELPEAELTAMRLDGEIQLVRGPAHAGWVSTAEAHGAPTRARSLAHLVRADWLLLGEAAAWVHLGGPAPAVILVGVPRGRARPPEGGVRLVERRWHRGDVVRLGGTPVATRRRIALDALRDQAFRADAALVLARRLGVGERELRAGLDELAGRPGTRRARERLERYALFTRATS